MVEYSERLKAAMARAQIKTRALSDAIGMSYQGVKKVIDGKSNAFSAENNSRAAAALGVSPDWLATGEGSMLPTPTPVHEPGNVAPAPAAPSPVTVEQALEVVACALESLSPILQQAGQSTLEKWVHGQASLAETATTLAALAQASQSLPSAPAVAETPVLKPQNT